MKIKDRPEFDSKPAPLTGRPDDTVADAVARMSERNYGSVVVLNDDGTVAGMVTERDILRRLVAGKRDPETTKLQDIMTREVRVANEDDNLYDWLRIMSNERFRRLPVVDAEGKLSSIMTQGDFVSYTWPELMSQASTLARSTVDKNYQVFLILGAVLVYTLVLAGVIGGFS